MFSLYFTIFHQFDPIKSEHDMNFLVGLKTGRKKKSMHLEYSNYKLLYTHGHTIIRQNRTGQVPMLPALARINSMPAQIRGKPAHQ